MLEEEASECSSHHYFNFDFNDNHLHSKKAGSQGFDTHDDAHGGEEAPSRHSLFERCGATLLTPHPSTLHQQADRIPCPRQLSFKPAADGKNTLGDCFGFGFDEGEDGLPVLLDAHPQQRRHSHWPGTSMLGPHHVESH